MSFDVFLIRFKNGEAADVDRLPVLEVLKATTYRDLNKGFYAVTFPDGFHVEFNAGGLESQEKFDGCAFHIRGFGNSLMKFMLEIARAGDMVMFPAMEGNPLIMVSEEQRKNVPVDLLASFPPVVVSSEDELGAVLKGGFQGWSAYRDYVLEKSKAQSESP
jgi:hypothetical protein